MERQRLKDEALAKQLANEDKALVSIPANATVIETPKSSRKRKQSSEFSKSTPAAKKINSFFSSKHFDSLLLFVFSLIYIIIVKFQVVCIPSIATSYRVHLLLLLP